MKRRTDLEKIGDERHGQREHVRVVLIGLGENVGADLAQGFQYGLGEMKNYT